MSYPSPLAEHYETLEAVTMPFGEAVAIVGEVASTEIEYAAIRKGVALLDCPHRALLRVSGKDRLDFLHRMFTNDCLSLERGDVRRMFLLNVKGRIMADLVVIEQGEHTLLETFVHEADLVAAELDKLLFGEDVQIENLTQSHHRISLHGPKADAVLQWWRDGVTGMPDAFDYRMDETGEPGIHIWAPAETFTRLAEKHDDLAETFALKHTGWLGYNMARIEAGTPLFHVDFGTDSLPHETGQTLLHEAVSFTKGCYRGQEVVARMQSLGHPAKLLVGWRGDGVALPVAGTPLREATEGGAKAVGAVTSSTFSPMLSSAPIGFAIVKWSHRAEGTELFAPVEGETA
ncbi:MAG: glycine cleavage T C-terminal barrel domain-containing protein, partial [Phycisphaeraceae bacterium]